LKYDLQLGLCDFERFQHCSDCTWLGSVPQRTPHGSDRFGPCTNRRSLCRRKQASSPSTPFFEVAVPHDFSRLVRLRSEIATDQFAKARAGAREERSIASRTWKSRADQRSRAQGSDRRKRGRSYILMVTAPARSPSPPPPPPKAPQHASCDVAKQLGSTPVYFFLSSTPDRAARLPRVLATMRRQSLQPAAIVLSIASTYNTSRFIHSTYTIAPELLNQQPRLVVHTVPHDLGPITKYAGVNYLLAHLQPASLARRAIVVVGDDDVFYGSSFIEDFACAVATGPENAVYSVNGAPGAKC